ncbi:hypothetical protein Tco_0897867 [Tanacetum coccineum]
MRTRSQSREQRPPPPEEPPVIIEPLRIEYPYQDAPVVPMADTRTMAQLLQAPTEGYEDAILIPEIVANLTDMLAKFVTANTASTSGSGTLPGNTVTNPREDLKGITTRSGVAYQGPPIPTSSVEKPHPSNLR